jgi:hypothetical protein
MMARMMSFSWQYNFTGAARTWVVSMMFCATGVICGLIVPFILGPSAVPGSLHREGIVVRMEADDGMVRPVFQFLDQHGTRREFPSGISSNSSAYHAGERVTVIFDPADPASAFVKDDKDLMVVFRITRILGLVFGSIGLAILGMKLNGMDDEVISRIGGLIGALTYAIPATLSLPGLWMAYGLRPNWLFASEATFGFDQWMIGSIFSVTGLLGIVGTIALYRYQARPGATGWYWSWNRSSNKER